MTTDWRRAMTLDALKRKGRRVVRMAGRQIALFDTPKGVLACNNRCPHEGYPLREGSLDGSCVLTCNWHNWKFDLATGANLYGGDRLRTYPVALRDGEIWIDLADEPFEARRAEIMGNLRDAFDEHDYTRLAREIARLRLLGADPVDAVAEAIGWSYERFEFGMTHAFAGAADWLALYDEFAGDPESQLVGLVEIVGHIAYDLHQQRRATSYPYADGVADYDEDRFVAAIEDEDEDTAVAMMRGALDGGLGFADVERGFARAALAHYNDFGHSLIYVVKVGRLIDRLGRRVAAPLLFSLVRSLVYATREDQIPEFRGYATALERFGRKANGVAPSAEAFRGLNVKHALALTADHGSAPAAALYRALLGANARNMATFDLAYQNHVDGQIADNIGWLDFTHAITFANALRLECAKFPELWPAGLLQMACFSGRNAAFTDPDIALEDWRVTDVDAFFDASVEGLFDHGRDEYIVSIHFVKTLLAARAEVRSGAAGEAARDVVAALNRLLNSPLKRKHARRTVHQAMAFVALDG